MSVSNLLLWWSWTEGLRFFSATVGCLLLSAFCSSTSELSSLSDCSASHGHSYVPLSPFAIDHVYHLVKIRSSMFWIIALWIISTLNNIHSISNKTLVSLIVVKLPMEFISLVHSRSESRLNPGQKFLSGYRTVLDSDQIYCPGFVLKIRSASITTTCLPVSRMTLPRRK